MTDCTLDVSYIVNGANVRSALDSCVMSSYVRGNWFQKLDKLLLHVEVEGVTVMSTTFSVVFSKLELWYWSKGTKTDADTFSRPSMCLN